MREWRVGSGQWTGSSAGSPAGRWRASAPTNDLQCLRRGVDGRQLLGPSNGASGTPPPTRSRKCGARRCTDGHTGDQCHRCGHDSSYEGGDGQKNRPPKRQTSLGGQCISCASWVRRSSWWLLRRRNSPVKVCRATGSGSSGVKNSAGDTPR